MAFHMDATHQAIMQAQAIAKFWSFVSKKGADECWLWTGPRFSRGTYPRFRFQQTMTGAHRFSYEIHNGPISILLQVCHRCDVPLCVNPGHLFLGTHKDNMADMHAKQRSGAKPAKRKFDERAIREIRSLTHLTSKQIAERFGVVHNTIFLIRKGLSYKWVTP